MSIDPSTAQGYADVFGGGPGGAILASLVAANIGQFLFAWRERAQFRAELERANEAHIATAKSVTSVASELADALKRSGHRRSERNGGIGP